MFDSNSQGAMSFDFNILACYLQNLLKFSGVCQVVQKRGTGKG